MTGRAEGDARQPSAPELSLVIPAFNEGLRLEAGFERLRHAIDGGAISPESTQFVFVDDGSTDNTFSLAQQLFSVFPQVKFVRLPENQGKGAAVRAGIAETTAPVVAFADADMAIDPDQVPKFRTALKGSDIAIGSRAAIGSLVDRPSLKRSAMNRAFNTFVNGVTHLRLNDTQCGFKAFRGGVARLLFHLSRTDRMAFDVEILSMARLLGYSVVQVPVNWSRVEGSRVRSFKDGASMVRDVLTAGSHRSHAPSVLATRVTLGAEDRRLAMPHLQELALVLPIVPVSSLEFLVLFPSQTAVTAQTGADALAERLSVSVTPLEQLSLDQLQQVAPWHLSWDDSAVSTEPA